jgi:hypothetical protein
LYLFTTTSANTGVTVVKLHATMTVSMSSGFSLLLANALSTAEKITSSASCRDTSMLRSGGMQRNESGTLVSSPIADF